MAYRVNIFSGAHCVSHGGWWRNFCDSFGYINGHEFDAEPVKFRAKRVPGIPFIEFESEEDFTMFLLKYA